MEEFSSISRQLTISIEEEGRYCLPCKVAQLHYIACVSKRTRISQRVYRLRAQEVKKKH